MTKFCDDHEWSGLDFQNCPECKLYQIERVQNFSKDNRFMRLAEEAGGARLAENVIQMTKDDLERFIYFVNEDY